MKINKIKLEEGILLESGQYLRELEIAYQTFGNINAEKSNVVWVCHALTANTNVVDWWEPLFKGKDAPFPLNNYFIICVNMLGSCYGTTGPLSINPLTNRTYFHDFP